MTLMTATAAVLAERNAEIERLHLHIARLNKEVAVMRAMQVIIDAKGLRMAAKNIVCNCATS